MNEQINAILRELGYTCSQSSWTPGEVGFATKDESQESVIIAVVTDERMTVASEVVREVSEQILNALVANEATGVIVFTSLRVSPDVIALFESTDFTVPCEIHVLDEGAAPADDQQPHKTPKAPPVSPKSSLEILDLLKDNLVDLTRANKLLNFSTKKDSIRIVRETPNDLYKILVTNRQEMELHPMVESDVDDDSGKHAALQIDHTLHTTKHPRLEEYSDSLIQTSLPPKLLQTVAGRTYTNARQAIRVTGSNQLFLAIGFLKWYEAEASELPALAPLVLIPIGISRVNKSVKERKIPGDADFDPGITTPQFRTVPRYVYHVAYTGDEIRENIALRLRMEVFQQPQPLPKIADYLESGDIEEYLSVVHGWASGYPADRRWERVPHATIALFDFTHAWMYDDLNDPAWKRDEVDHLDILFGGGSSGELTPFADGHLERSEAAVEIPLVTPADPSQYQVILRALSTRALVVEGPPGTGKSQTITNIIAACLDRGDRVLFLAAKETALTVVSERLAKVGLSPFLLPVYATGKTAGTSTKDIADNLKQVYEKTSVRVDGRPADEAEVVRQAQQLRGKLNHAASSLKRIDIATGKSLSWLLWSACEARERYHIAAAARDRAPVDLDVAAVVRERGLQAPLSDAEDFVHRLDTMRDLGQLDPDRDWSGLVVTNLTDVGIEHLLATTAELARLADSLLLIALPPGLSLTTPFDPRRVLLVEAGLRESPLPSWTLPALGTERVMVADLKAACAGLECMASDLELRGRHVAELKVPPTSLPSVAMLAALQQSREVVQASCPAWQNAGDQQVLDAVHRSIDSIHQMVMQINGSRDILQQIPCADPAALPVADISRWLEVVRYIQTSTGVDWSLLRSEFGKALANDLCNVLKQRCDDLAAEEQYLRSVFDFTAMPSADQLKSIKAGLRQDGWWSTIFGAFSRARKTITQLGLLKIPFAPATVINAISRYQEWVHACEKFDQDWAAREAFGILFAGRQTHWLRLTQSLSVVRGIGQICGLTRLPHVLSGPPPRVAPEILEEAAKSFAALSDLARTTPALADYNLTRTTAMTWGALITILTRVLADLKTVLAWFDRLPLQEWRGLTVAACGEVLAKARVVADLDDALAHHESRSLLGGLFRGPETDPFQVGRLINVLRGMKTFSAALDNDPGVVEWLSTCSWNVVVPELAAWQSSLMPVCTALSRCEELLVASGTLHDADIFRVSHCGLPLREWLQAIQARHGNPKGLYAWKAVSARLQVGQQLGLGVFLQEYLVRSIDSAYLLLGYTAAVRGAYVRQIQHQMGVSNDDVNEAYQGRIRESFRTYDAQLVRFAPGRIAASCLARSLPQEGGGGARISERRGMALLQTIAGGTSKVSVRDIMNRARLTLMHKKPCWLMSPGSVSQYLPRIPDLFDVLIIDEASQLRTAEVAPAALRCKRILIFGDSKQMPPFTLGNKFSGDTNAEFHLGESVLDLAVRSVPSVMLKWHYRSQHEDLIRYSNRWFYDDKLVVFPTANPKDKDLGVFHIQVPGLYVASRNMIEAERCAEIMRDHLVAQLQKLSDQRRSLGVVAMNIEQRDLILQVFDQTRAEDPELNRACIEDGRSEEEFFVRNLESVQGDERDHMIISCTYGPEVPGGTVNNHFGPISMPGGERRLNVLFTRARYRMTVLSSMLPHQIKSPVLGAKHLRGFIEYAKDPSILADHGDRGGNSETNMFEQSVGDAIRRAGYQVACQVGVIGFAIDLAVIDPDDPGRYLLGIECDGATYHSSATARERDRLRQECLESKQWKFHRVWSTDWFHDRIKAEANLLRAIRDRHQAIRQRRERDGHELAVSAAAAVNKSHATPGRPEDGQEMTGASERSGRSAEILKREVDGNEADFTEPEETFNGSTSETDESDHTTPEKLPAAAINRTILRVLDDVKYLRREALLKAICLHFGYDVRGERRSAFGMRVWRQVRLLERRREVKIGGANDDSVSRRR